MRRLAVRIGLETLFFSGAHRVMRRFTGGVGGILMLHHVRPERADAFQPNRGLEITPEFLTTIVRRLQRSGVDFVSLDEVHRRLTEQDFGPRFVAMTLDDGYRDDKEWAYPILKQHDVPFAIYVPSGFPDRVGQLWWVALEQIIARNDTVALAMDGRDCRVSCRSVREKYQAYEHLYWWLRSQPSDAAMFAIMRELSARYRVDLAEICETLCMSWEDLAALAADPLVTIGSHTVNHALLAKAPADAVRSELKMGRAVIEAALGRPPRHLAYPYGDSTAVGPREYAIAAELGFLTAVTTRPGALFPEHGGQLTALPRIPINGNLQSGRYVDVLVSGASSTLSRAIRGFVPVVAEFVGLVKSGYLDAAQILVGPGWAERDRLLSRLEGIPAVTLKGLVTAVSQLGREVVVPGVKPREARRQVTALPSTPRSPPHRASARRAAGRHRPQG